MEGEPRFSPYALVLHGITKQDARTVLAVVVHPKTVRNYPLLSEMTPSDSSEGGVTLPSKYPEAEHAMGIKRYGHPNPYPVRDIRLCGGHTPNDRTCMLAQWHGPYCTRDELIQLKEFLETILGVRVTTELCEDDGANLDPNELDMCPIE